MRFEFYHVRSILICPRIGLLLAGNVLLDEPGAASILEESALAGQRCPKTLPYVES